MAFHSLVSENLRTVLPSLNKVLSPPPNFMACVKCVFVRQAKLMDGEKAGINFSCSALAVLAERQDSKAVLGTFTTSMLW